MRRRIALAQVGMLVVVLLVACGQPVVTPVATATVASGAGASTATVGASPTRPGTPGTPVAATPGPATRVASPSAVIGSPTRGTATATRAQGSASPTMTADPALRALLAALPETREILIEDDWTGLSQNAPLEAHYRLVRRGDDFVGPARAASGGYGHKAKAAMAEVTVPADTARAFFALLAQTPVRPGQYKPVSTHTDDYPSISIVLETPVGRLIFGTASNTKGHVPWYVGTDTADFVSDYDTPNQALGLLNLSAERGSGKVESPAGPDPLFCRTPAVTGDPIGDRAIHRASDTINMAREHGLAGLVAVEFEGGKTGRISWREPQQIATLVATLDQPVALIESAFWSSYDSTWIYLKFSERDYFSVQYNPYLDVIDWQREPPARNKPIYTVAPPGFRELVLGEVCGR